MSALKTVCFSTLLFVAGSVQAAPYVHATKLSTATAEDASAKLEELFQSNLDRSLASNPDVRMITRNNIDVFGQHSWTFKETLVQLLDRLDQSRAYPRTLSRELQSWGTEIFSRCEDDGVVTTVYEGNENEDCTFLNKGLARPALMLARHENALSRVEEVGFSFEDLIKKWKEAIAWTSLDVEFLPPVQLSRLPANHQVSAIVGKVYDLETFTDLETGGDAASGVQGFRRSPYGGELYGMNKVYELLQGGDVAATYYLSAGDEHWAADLLIIIDRANQMYGFYVGYSE